MKVFSPSDIEAGGSLCVPGQCSLPIVLEQTGLHSETGRLPCSPFFQPLFHSNPPVLAENRTLQSHVKMNNTNTNKEAPSERDFNPMKPRVHVRSLHTCLEQRSGHKTREGRLGHAVLCEGRAGTPSPTSPFS